MSVVPVRLVRVAISGGHATRVMIDMEHYAGLGDNPDERITELNEEYGRVVESVRRIFYNDAGGRAKSVPSSLHLKAGKTCLDFLVMVQDRFRIENYTAALSVDMGLTQGYVAELLSMAKLFDESDIIDSVPLTYYSALRKKRRWLEKAGLFDAEKRRLISMGRSGTLPPRKSYYKELDALVSGATAKASRNANPANE